MATMGPTTQRHVDRLAGNLLRRARAQKGMTQRQLAELAGVPQSSIAKIESGTRQPTLPVLTRILVAVDLEPRIALEPYDDHDDVWTPLLTDALTCSEPQRLHLWTSSSTRCRPANVRTRDRPGL